MEPFSCTNNRRGLYLTIAGAQFDLY